MDAEAMKAAQREPVRIYTIDPAFLQRFKARQDQAALATTWETIRQKPHGPSPGPYNVFLRKRARRNAAEERRRHRALKRATGERR